MYTEYVATAPPHFCTGLIDAGEFHTVSDAGLLLHAVDHVPAGSTLITVRIHRLLVEVSYGDRFIIKGTGIDPVEVELIRH